MLSEKTQSIICNLLTTIANNETEIEAARINLNNHPQFDPYSIFQRIDSERTNSINEQNIISFLRDNSINCSLKEAQEIISLYDNNKTGVLSYSQFLNFILKEGIIYKKYISKKIIYPNFIPYSLEFLVCRIFQIELRLINVLQNIINELKHTNDFSVFDMFQIITQNSILSYESLNLFLNANNVKLNNDDLKRIINRLDVDKNGIVTIEDLETIFGKDKEHYIKDDSKLLSKNQLIGNGIISPINVNNQKLKQGNTLLNNTKENKTIQVNSNQQSFPERQRDNNIPLYSHKDNIYSNTYVNPFSTSNPFIKQTHNTNIEAIISFLKLLMDIELQIEKLKIQLISNTDFNIDDAFRLFQHSNTHYITESDLQKGLNTLGIFPKEEELYLLMNKYSLSGHNSLNYADVFDMLTPFNKEYRNEVEHRQTNPYSPKYNKEDIFVSTTKECLVNLFKFIIKSEVSIENERKKMNKLFDVNIRTAFKMIDKSQCNKFSILDLNLFLKDNFVCYIPKEADLLFIRLDRKREGMIDLQQFAYETIPKLSS